jgi:hypothetical protein
MRKIIYLLILLFSSFTSFSQISSLTLNGYLKDLYMYYKPELPLPGTDADYLSSNLIHNRLNLRWYTNNEITLAVEARNRLYNGQLIREFGFYKNMTDSDPGYFDLAFIVASGNSWFLHTVIDRAWVDYTKGKWQIVAGRQRINWGINLVWNPNDIFNTFDYFDFDYEERPGSDALQIKYYTGVTSSAEIVYKIQQSIPDNKTESTFAGRYKFSKFRYDFQFLGGFLPNDYVLGGGWMGDIKGGGFRGEISWFVPKETYSEETLTATISGDYTFKKSLYAHAAILYNSSGKTGKAGTREFFDMNISAKMLTPARFNIFGQLSYPFTPLFSGNLSGIINPSDGSFFLGPLLTYSLGNNLELMLTAQLFFGEEGTEYGELGKVAYGRLKWSF